MATYIQNVQDKVATVRPPQTNWQFEAQLLSTRQAKYDAGHKKLSDMYGKILNSGLTRDINIESREEFFKLIDSDLRKVAGLDLSLDSNVSQAQHVFNQIYENDYLVKDMVWTKNYQSEVQRAEGFKNCQDYEKCGGQYWDEGMKYMNYKREEFKNSSNDESMGMGNVRFIPYNNMMDKAIEYAEEAGLKVTLDKPSGKYIYRTVNGENVISPLTEMFGALFRDNPQYYDMYKVQAYNKRKDWTHQAVQSGEFNTLEDAALGYIEQQGEGIIANAEEIANGVDLDVSSIEGKLKALKKDFDNGVYTDKDTEKVKEANDLNELLGQAMMAKQATDRIKSAQKNKYNQRNMNAIASMIDESLAMDYLNSDLLKASKTLAHRDMEITMTADDFALENLKAAHRMAQIRQQGENAMAVARYKALYGDGSTVDTDISEKGTQLDVASKALLNYDVEDAVKKAMGQGESNYVQNASLEEIVAWLNDPAQQGDKVKVRKAMEDAVAEKHRLQSQVNLEAIQLLEALGAESTDEVNRNIHWENITTDVYNDLVVQLGKKNMDMSDLSKPKGAVISKEKYYAVMQLGDKTDATYYKDGNNTWHKGPEFGEVGPSGYKRVTDANFIDVLNTQAVIIK